MERGKRRCSEDAQATDRPLKRVKRRRGRGKRKSKAERMALRQSIGRLSLSDAPDGAASHGKDPLMTSLKTLLASHESEQWDLAAQMASRMNDPVAKRLVVQSVLFQHHKPKAAMVYAKRLGFGMEMDVDVEFCALLQSKKHQEAGLIARFLVEMTTSTTTTTSSGGGGGSGDGSGVNQTLWQLFALPWLARQEFAAVQVLLHNNHVLKQKAVREFLDTGVHLHLVNQYAHGYLPLLQHIMKNCLVTHPRQLHQHQRQNSMVHQHSTTTADCHQQCIAERTRRQEIARGLQTLLQLVWQDAQVHLFGSSVTGLGGPTNDLDLCVTIPSCGAVFRQATRDIIGEMQQHLDVYFSHGDTSSCVAVKDARIPLVKLKEPKSHLQVDLCVNNLAAIWNTQLIDLLVSWKTCSSSSRTEHGHEDNKDTCCRHESQVFRVTWILKKWFRKRRLTSLHGHHALSSYAVVLLVLYYFQVRGRLPFVNCEQLYRENLHELEQLDAQQVRKRITQQIKLQANQIHCDSEPNDLWIVMDFFKYYAFEFEFTQQVVSLRVGDATRETKQWKVPMHHKKKLAPALCIEDPIEISRDLGKYLTRNSLRTLRLELLRSCILLGTYGNLPDQQDRLLRLVLRERLDGQSVMLHGDEAWWQAHQVETQIVDSAESVRRFWSETLRNDDCNAKKHGADTEVLAMAMHQHNDHVVIMSQGAPARAFLFDRGTSSGKEMYELLLTRLQDCQQSVHVVVFDGCELDRTNSLPHVIDLRQEFRCLVKAFKATSMRHQNNCDEDDQHIGAPCGKEQVQTKEEEGDDDDDDEDDQAEENMTLDGLIYQQLGVCLTKDDRGLAQTRFKPTTLQAEVAQVVYLLPLYDILVRKKRLVLHPPEVSSMEQ